MLCCRFSCKNEDKEEEEDSGVGVLKADWMGDICTGEVIHRGFLLAKLFFFSGERFEVFLVSFMASWVSIGRTSKVKRKIRMVNLTPFANLSGWTGGKILKGVPKE